MAICRYKEFGEICPRDGDCEEHGKSRPNQTICNSSYNDPINPDHYKWHPVCEAIDISEHFVKNLGSAIEYIWRVGRKPNGNPFEDLDKAIWYLNREKERLRGIPKGK